MPIDQLHSENAPPASGMVPLPLTPRAEPLGHEDDSWMNVHTLNVVPPQREFTFTAHVIDLGRGEPLSYPDPFGDDESDE